MSKISEYTLFTNGLVSEFFFPTSRGGPDQKVKFSTFFFEAFTFVMLASFLMLAGTVSLNVAARFIYDSFLLVVFHPNFLG